MSKARLVYSSGPAGRTAGRPAASSDGEAVRSIAQHDLRIWRSSAGRAGKTVTVIEPFHLQESELKQLLSRFKKLCGAGGALKPASKEQGRALEIQGDQVERILAELLALGFKVKRSGG